MILLNGNILRTEESCGDLCFRYKQVNLYEYIAMGNFRLPFKLPEEHCAKLVGGEICSKIHIWFHA
jgi:hypothetical protein